jgi:WD40 repeat protein
MNITAREESKASELIEEKKPTFVEGVKIIKPSDITQGEEDFLFTVDYSQTLKEMIKAAGFDWVDEAITQKRFPLPNELFGKKLNLRAKLFHFDDYIGSERAIAKIKKADHRFKLATLAEQLAFAKEYRELQKEFPIISLGSKWKVTRHSSRVTAIDFGPNGRELATSSFEGIWLPSCRFLTVFK